MPERPPVTGPTCNRRRGNRRPPLSPGGCARTRRRRHGRAKAAARVKLRLRDASRRARARGAGRPTARRGGAAAVARHEPVARDGAPVDERTGLPNSRGCWRRPRRAPPTRRNAPTGSVLNSPMPRRGGRRARQSCRGGARPPRCTRSARGGSPRPTRSSDGQRARIRAAEQDRDRRARADAAGARRRGGEAHHRELR